MSAERRRSESKRAYTRRKKAEIRDDFALSGEQREAAKFKAQVRLTALNQSLIDLLDVWVVNQTNLPALQEDFAGFKFFSTGAENHDTALVLGRFMGMYLTATLTDSRQTQHALGFVERTWLRFGLELIGEKERNAEINAFLDTCPGVLLEFLTTETQLPDGRWLTPLQQVKNRVINPITGALDVR
ncbi:MAG: hypothetical protein A2784_04615 [Candidatus Chisholmbacteria bacterium RIFCSPHIGHO2_01_FULL_48_12]|uniref:Uncharacterized protein n=1 Tax=Candidatus Chisholmbacteria bacterium RIFCSPHIGHO2_01_FULL_48_12 TaxID=1797589 RepID=A0A1G1VMV3_9BACT|nr:MAG: hypothetical protein A2784_04615 [Candidatus Chisholmbacteria bacterium RIFCSPHIGHO2_01_FULL_48_12]